MLTWTESFTKWLPRLPRWRFRLSSLPIGIPLVENVSFSLLLPSMPVNKLTCCWCSNRRKEAEQAEHEGCQGLQGCKGCYEGCLPSLWGWGHWPFLLSWPLLLFLSSFLQAMCLQARNQRLSRPQGLPCQLGHSIQLSVLSVSKMLGHWHGSWHCQTSQTGKSFGQVHLE